MSRPIPLVSERTAEFWRAGADGRLRIQKCDACGLYLQPPRPLCPRCRSSALSFQPVSGRGSVYSYTLNRYPWAPGMEPPYIIAEVELEEQDGLRLLSNLVDVDWSQVEIGMPVKVEFLPAGEYWIPVFRRAIV